MTDIVNTNGKDTVKYHETERFNRWCQFYFDKTNKDTYGNATQSAIRAYNYDPIAQYSLAGLTGHNNVRKHKAMGMMHGEEKGLGFLKLIDWAISQMFKTGDTKWFEIVRDMLGYTPEQNDSVQVNVPVQINNLINEDREKYK